MSNSLRQLSELTMLDPRAFPPGLVAVPTVDWMWTSSALALLGIFAALPPNSGMNFMPEAASSIAAKRTQLVEQMLDTPHFEWIAFIDSDMHPPANSVLRLLSHELDVVSALYMQRQPPYVPAVRFLENGPPRPEEYQGPAAVNAVGFGMIVIRRQVFERVPRPWFADDPNTPGLNEDFHFCHRAREAGYKIHLDAALECGHVGSTIITPAFASAWQTTPEGQQQLAECHAYQAPAPAKRGAAV
jgi:hypothetical protein